MERALMRSAAMDGRLWRLAKASITRSPSSLQTAIKDDRKNTAAATNGCFWRLARELSSNSPVRRYRCDHA